MILKKLEKELSAQPAYAVLPSRMDKLAILGEMMSEVLKGIRRQRL
jgi:hypothetical protein